MANNDLGINPLLEACYSAIRERMSSPDYNTEDWQKNTLSYFRNHLEPFVFQYVESQNGKMLTEFWKTYQFPVKSKRAWVITERRVHQNWWFLLRNIAWAAPDMALYIFCSENNMPYLRSLLGDKATNVHLIPWFSGFPSPTQQYKEFNDAWKTPELWKQIDAEYILRIELDCIVPCKIPDDIFVTDFYGSPWGWQPERCGGGGLSIRRVSKCLEACLSDSNKDDILPEDCWLEHRLTNLGFKYPDLKFRSSVFMENIYVTKPIGIHQFWTFILNYNPQNRETFQKIIAHILTFSTEQNTSSQATKRV